MKPGLPSAVASAGLAVLLGASGCAEPQPWWTETEHLRVFGHRDTEVCAGTPAALEREFVRLLDVMQLPEPDETIDVVIGPDTADGCAADYAACAGRTEEGTLAVLSPLELVDHELVHGVRQATGVRGSSFYEEGLAEVLRAGALAGHVIASSPGRASDVDALQLTKLDTYEDYQVAASFTGWLRARTDPEAFAAAFSSREYAGLAMRDELEQWFLDAFALSLDEATLQWEQTQPHDYVYAGPCVANDPSALQGGQHEESGRLDCAGDDATVGPFSDPEATVRSDTRCLHIAEVDRLSISIDAPSSVRLELRPRRCETGEILPTSPVVGGEVRELELPSGSCWLELDVRGASDVVAEYRWAIVAQ